MLISVECNISEDPIIYVIILKLGPLATVCVCTYYKLKLEIALHAFSCSKLILFTTIM